MRPLSVVAFSLCLLLSSLPASSPGAGAREAGEPRLRVLLAEKGSGALVKGTHLTIRVLGEPVEEGEQVVAGVARASFMPAGDRVVLAGADRREKGFSVSSADGFCEVNGAVMRGRLLVAAGEDGLTLVAAVPLESYLVGLVNGEINSLWPAEAVKAQVVAARTYALGKIALGRKAAWDVKPDVSHQVYPGVFAEDLEAARAVRETRGLALYRDGRLLEALFHSTCGGRTASAEEVWGVAAPGLASVACSDCGASPQSRWTLIIPSAEADAAVNRLYPGAGRVLSLAVRSLTPSGRARSVSVTAAGGAFLLDAGDLRRELGTVRLPSTAFMVEGDGAGFVFSGRGYGHGAGMCQWGARGAAQRGLAFSDILSRYYQGAELKRAYP
jgi:stage II sporulation protein D